MARYDECLGKLGDKAQYLETDLIKSLVDKFGEAGMNSRVAHRSAIEHILSGIDEDLGRIKTQAQEFLAPSAERQAAGGLATAAPAESTEPAAPSAASPAPVANPNAVREERVRRVLRQAQLSALRTQRQEEGPPALTDEEIDRQSAGMAPTEDAAPAADEGMDKIPHSKEERADAWKQLSVLRKRLSEAEAAAAKEGRALSVKDRELVHHIVRLQTVAHSDKPIAWLKGMVTKKVEKANGYLKASEGNGNSWDARDRRQAESLRSLAYLIMEEARGFAGVIKKRTGEVVPTAWSSERRPASSREADAMITAQAEQEGARTANQRPNPVFAARGEDAYRWDVLLTRLDDLHRLWDIQIPRGHGGGQKSYETIAKHLDEYDQILAEELPGIIQQLEESGTGTARDKRALEEAKLAVRRDPEFHRRRDPHRYDANIRRGDEIRQYARQQQAASVTSGQPSVAQDGTVAEPEQDIQAAMQAVLDGRKPAAYDATGKAKALKGLVTVKVDGAKYFYKAGGPFKRNDILRLHAEGKQAEILGYEQNKDEVRDPDNSPVVSAIDETGAHVSDQLVDPERVEDAAASAQEQAGEGGSVEVSTADEAIRQRLARMSAEELATPAVGRSGPVTVQGPSVVADLEDAPLRVGNAYSVLVVQPNPDYIVFLLRNAAGKEALLAGKPSKDGGYRWDLGPAERSKTGGFQSAGVSRNISSDRLAELLGPEFGPRLANLEETAKDLEDMQRGILSLVSPNLAAHYDAAANDFVEQVDLRLYSRGSLEPKRLAAWADLRDRANSVPPDDALVDQGNTLSTGQRGAAVEPSQETTDEGQGQEEGRGRQEALLADGAVGDLAAWREHGEALLRLYHNYKDQPVSELAKRFADSTKEILRKVFPGAKSFAQRIGLLKALYDVQFEQDEQGLDAAVNDQQTTTEREAPAPVTVRLNKKRARGGEAPLTTSEVRGVVAALRQLIPGVTLTELPNGDWDITIQVTNDELQLFPQKSVTQSVAPSAGLDAQDLQKALDALVNSLATGFNKTESRLEVKAREKSTEDNYTVARFNLPGLVNFGRQLLGYYKPADQATQKHVSEALGAALGFISEKYVLPVKKALAAGKAQQEQQSTTPSINKSRNATELDIPDDTIVYTTKNGEGTLTWDDVRQESRGSTQLDMNEEIEAKEPGLLAKIKETNSERARIGAWLDELKAVENRTAQQNTERSMLLAKIKKLKAESEDLYARKKAARKAVNREWINRRGKDGEVIRGKQRTATEVDDVVLEKYQALSAAVDAAVAEQRAAEVAVTREEDGFGSEPKTVERLAKAKMAVQRAERALETYVEKIGLERYATETVSVDGTIENELMTLAEERGILHQMEAGVDHIENMEEDTQAEREDAKQSALARGARNKKPLTEAEKKARERVQGYFDGEQVEALGGESIKTLAGVVRGVLKTLGLQTRIRLVDEAGLDQLIATYKDVVDASEGTHESAQWAHDLLLRMRTKGTGFGYFTAMDIMSTMEDRMPVIYISDTIKMDKGGKPRDMRDMRNKLKVLAHELGHLIEFTYLDQVRKMAKHQDPKVAAEAKEMLGGLQEAWLQSGQNPEAFSEWMANQFVAYVASRDSKLRRTFEDAGKVTDNKGVRAFLEGLYDKIQELWEVLTKKYRLSQTYDDFITGVIAEMRGRSEGRTVTGEYGRRFARVAAEFTTSPYMEHYKNAPSRKEMLAFTPPMQRRARSLIDYVKRNPHVVNARGWASAMHRFGTQSMDSYLRSLGLDDIADIFNHRPGVDRPGGVEPIDRELRRSYAEWHRKANTLLGRFAEKKWYHGALGFKDGTLNTESAVYKDVVRALIGQYDPPAGPAREAVMEIRAYFEELYKYFQQMGLEFPHRKNFFPTMYRSSEVINREREFIQTLLDFGLSRKQAFDMFRTVTHSDGSMISPGIGFGHMKHRQLNRQELKVLHDKGFLESDLSTVMLRYADRGIHKAIVQRHFGKEVLQDDGSTTIEPLGKLMERLNKARANGDLTASEHERVMNVIIPGLFGQLGVDMDPRWKRFEAFAITLENFRLLAGATLSSLPDIAGVFVRGDWDALQSGMRKMLSKMDRAQMRELAERLGVIRDDYTTHAFNDGVVDQYMGSGFRRWNEAFFRAIGMHHWTNFTRIAALASAVDFIKAKSAAAKTSDAEAKQLMTELGLTPEQVDRWLADGAPPPAEWGTESFGEHRAVYSALSQFVDEAIMRPNASIRPWWGNDQRLAVFFHLKSFIWNFQEVMLRRLWSQVKTAKGMHKVAPVVAFAVPYMLLAALGYEIRRWLSWGGEPPKGKEGGDYWFEVLQRSGGLGVFQLMVDSEEAADRGKLWLLAPLGPTVGHLEEFITQPFYDSFPRSIPLVAQSPALKAALQNTFEDVGLWDLPAGKRTYNDKLLR